MPPVRYAFARQADRDVARLAPGDQQRILAALDRYIGDPRTGDVKKLSGMENQYRLRVGNLRVRFSYADNGRTLVVTRVLPRGQAYRD